MYRRIFCYTNKQMDGKITSCLQRMSDLSTKVVDVATHFCSGSITTIHAAHLRHSEKSAKTSVWINTPEIPMCHSLTTKGQRSYKSPRQDYTVTKNIIHSWHNNMTVKELVVMWLCVELSLFKLNNNNNVTAFHLGFILETTYHSNFSCDLF